jgi:hypothetical protein
MTCLAVVAVLVVPACSGSSSTLSSTTPTTSPSTSPSSAPAAGPDLSDASTTSAATSTSTASTLPVPAVRIGWVNDDVRFPGARRGLDEALTVATDERGGLAGRPVELVECPVASPDEAARCVQQFVAEGVVAVLTGVIVDGGRALYDGLDGRIPVLIGTAVTVDDLTTPAGVLYTSGPAGLATGLAASVVDLTAAAPEAPVAVLVDDDAPGRTLAELFVLPVLAAAGRGVTVVPVPTTDAAAAADAVATAWIDAGLDAPATAPGVVVDLLGPGRCGLVATVTTATGVTTGGCTDDLADVPLGWFVVHPGTLPDTASSDPASSDTGGWWTAGPVRANVAALDAALQRAGDDDPVALLAALRNGRLEGWQTGPSACGEVTILGIDQFAAVCGTTVAVHRRVADGWEPIRTPEVGGLVPVPA